MWLQLATTPTAVGLYDLGAIESHALERIDGNENDSGVSVDAMLGVAVSDCVQNWDG